MAEAELFEKEYSTIDSFDDYLKCQRRELELMQEVARIARLEIDDSLKYLEKSILGFYYAVMGQD